MRTAFLGTPDAAVPTLRALAEVAEVAVVVSQPDRPRGRSGTPRPSAVTAAALDLGLAVERPEQSSAIAPILASAGHIDVAVLVAFGMLIRPDALSIPAAGVVNVHFSLLPRWRGAAPVHRAILEGDHRTGVTIMQLDEGLDTGPVLACRSTAIGPDETTGELTARLAVAGAGLVHDLIDRIVAGRVVSVAQGDRGATHAPKIDGDERWLDVGADTSTILRHVRGMAPSPGSWATHGTGRFRIHRAVAASAQAAPGELLEVDGGVVMGTGDGAIRLLVVQPEGKKAMAAGDWVRGRKGDLGRLA